MDYGEVLNKAWKIVWKYKVLWIFGILAGFAQGGGGGGGGGGGNYSGGNNNFNPPNFRQGDFNFNFLPPEMQRGFEEFSRTVSSIPWFVWVMIVLGLLFIALVFWLLSIVGKVGLIKGSKLADESEEKLPFGALLSKVWPYFWKFLLLELLICLAGFVLGLVIAIPIVLFAVMTLGVGMLCILPLLCLLIPLGLLVETFVKQAEIALVADDLGVFDSIKAAWNVIKKNFWAYVIMTLILVIGGSVVGFILALPFLLVFVPPFIALVANGFSNFNGLQTPLIISLVICCILVPIYWLVNGVLTAYIQSAWTLTYLRLKQPIEVLPEPVVLEPTV
jgi:ABC-type phosphate/phosphonate transport system permease subunit